MDVTEIFSKLQRSLSLVASTKTQFDVAQDTARAASENYQIALKESTDLRTQLDEALNSQMGKADNRVRTSE